MTTAAKEFLQQYLKSEFRLKQLEDQLYTLRMKMEGCGPGASASGPVQGSPQADRLGALYEQYEAQEKEMEAEREGLKNTMLDVRLAISYVQDHRLRSLLEYRYLFNRDWWWIKSQLHHGYSYTRGELHDKAVAAVDWLKYSK